MGSIGLAALPVLAVALLLFLVLVVRLHAFLALLVTSLAVAVAGGMPLAEIAGSIQDSMGRSLGYIAVVIGVGAMFGELLRRSGGAAAIAHALLRTFGDKRAPAALGLTGLVVAIPVFFDVAFILFVPLLYSLTKKSGRPLLDFAIPLLAGLAVAHSFIPPTPGPVAVAGLLGADLGWVIVFGLACGLPALAVGGLWLGPRIARRIPHGVPEEMHLEVSEAAAGQTTGEPAEGGAGFGRSLALIALPLILILSATVTRVILPEGDRVRDLLSFFGHPFTALTLATLAAFYFLGRRCGFSPKEIQAMASKSLEPVGLILLVTGAGGVLGKTLVAVGVGEAVAGWLSSSRLPLVLLAFVLAAVVRVAQGSATVSMVTAAGLVAPVIEAAPVPAPMLGAVTIAIASGATVLSHFNDSGFWLVSRYLGLSEQETLRSWTVMATLVGVTGLVMASILSMVL
jgi:gluconate transporter